MPTSRALAVREAAQALRYRFPRRQPPMVRRQAPLMALVVGPMLAASIFVPAVTHQPAG